MSGVIKADLGYAVVRSTALRIPALTGIRGVAAVWVVLFHLLAVASVGNVDAFSHIPIVRSGHLSVDMFFVLSGFVLTMTFGQAFAQPSWPALRDFWIGRVFRILPIHWTALALYVGLYALLGSDLVMTQRHDAASLLASALLVQSWLFMPKSWNLPAWSLSAEWLAYIAFPAMIMISAKANNPSRIIGASLSLFGVLIAACWFAGDISLDHIRSLGLARCLIEFPIGIMMYRLWKQEDIRADQADKILLFGLLLLGVAMTRPVFDLIAVPAFAMIVLASASKSPLAEAAMGNRVAVLLGEISFSAYILHWIMIELAAYLVVTKGVAGVDAAWVFAVGFAAVWPIAWLSWRYIELPSQRVGKALLRHRSTGHLRSYRVADILEIADVRRRVFGRATGALR